MAAGSWAENSKHAWRGLLYLALAISAHAQVTTTALSSSPSSPVTPGTTVTFTISTMNYSYYWQNTNGYVILQIGYQDPGQWANTCNVQYQPKTGTVYLAYDRRDCY